jgi:SRSO17 transposase
LQAAKYVQAVMSDLPKRNGWTIAEKVGDPSPDATQRLLNRARWDTLGAMSAIRRFAVTRLDAAARRAGLTVGALDEPGQEKKGTATAGVKRQHMGCASGIDNDINLVHLAYVRAGTGHALIGSRQWIPPSRSACTARNTVSCCELGFCCVIKAAAATIAGCCCRWSIG